MIYLCSPYTRYAAGIWAAYAEAARIAGAFIKAGVPVFSPIAHSHSIAMEADIDPLDGAFWKNADEPFIALCDECYVAMMDGWRDSSGVAYEIEAFTKAGKRVQYLDPETLKLRDAP
jgi:hypothetical protein